MQGNGPCWGTAVDHRVAVAGLDWLATDRVGLELMGIDPTWPAYLNYCAQAGLGQYDLSKIEVIGERVSDHAKKYQLHANVAGQLRVPADDRCNDENEEHETQRTPVLPGLGPVYPDVRRRLLRAGRGGFAGAVPLAPRRARGRGLGGGLFPGWKLSRLGQR
jgi:hypothetical protein